MKIYAKSILAGFLLCASPASLTQAQTPSNTQDNVAYNAVYFEQFNALTALDMARQVPGFSVSGGTSRRGLAGTLSNVLINGSRVSTKGTGVNATLSRIPATDVEQIDLIRSAQAGIDMRGQNQVINIILKPGAGRSGALRLRLTHWANDRLRPSGDASVTFASPDRDITLGTELISNGNGQKLKRRLYDQDRALINSTDERDNRVHLEISPYFRFTQRFNNGDVLNISGQHWNWKYDWINMTHRSFASGDPQSFEHHRRDHQGTRTDINLDYERRLSDTLTAQFIGYWRDSNPDTATEYTTVHLNRDWTTRVRIDDVVSFGEAIGRTQLRWTPEGDHAFEFALERAFNYRDSDYDRYHDIGQGFYRVDLPLSNARVEEVRWDTSLAHIWQARSDLKIETTLGYEMSTITQTGDAEQERDLSYFKPTMVATWTPNTRDQFRLGLFRDIGQLDFQDFISSVDLRDDQVNTGNPNLEPFQAWRIMAQWERRFDEDNSLRVTANHGHYEALSGTIPLGEGEGPGSLKDGIRSQVEIRGSFTLGRFGLDGAKIEPRLMLTHTDITDPFTGETRTFPGLHDWFFEANYRHDLPNTDWAWGFNYGYYGTTHFFRLREEGEKHLAYNELKVFLETTAFLGVTARLETEFPFEDWRKRNRYIYDAPREGQAWDRYEIMERSDHRSVYLEISKTF